MEYEEIVAVVRQASGGIGSEAADRALQATLQTLAERLPRGEARHIVQELPAELNPLGTGPASSTPLTSGCSRTPTTTG